MALDESSQPIEVLLSVRRGGSLRLGTQIEDQFRQAIRDGALRPDACVPSTRDLSRQLGVSRRVVVDAYAQLAAEGYLNLRQGARPRVSKAALRTHGTVVSQASPARRARFDLRPSLPDVSMFPRRMWLRSVGAALRNMTDDDLGYGDPRGVESLRSALADYLGRSRGVVCDPEHILITTGYAQGLGLVCQALAERGAKRIALEDPSNPEDRLIVARAGLEPLPVTVDARGLRTSELARSDADAVALTPAHQHPTGAVLSGERRTELLSWLRERQAIAIEDDYDAEYRYDRAAVGALQGLDPERVVYAGSLSKTLAPALRIGWLALPDGLLEAVCTAKLHADRGTDRIEQHALADFLVRGEMDRHIRRMRAVYRRRRDALIDALSDALPEASVSGVAAGLHVTVSLPDDHDEQAIRKEAEHRRIALETMSDFQWSSGVQAPTLVLGYGQLPEPAVPAAVAELVRAVRAAHTRSGTRRAQADGSQ
jgi:GntR family transcriptional regulator/MocR family aminotransferase